MIFEYGLAVDVVRGLWRQGEGEIDLVAAEFFHELLGVVWRDGELAIRKGLAEFADDGGQDVLAGGGAGSDAQAPGAPATQGFELSADALHALVDAFRGRQENVSGFGKVDFSSEPVY